MEEKPKMCGSGFMAASLPIVKDLNKNIADLNKNTEDLDKNTHPTYCPRLEKDCESKGLVDCINEIDSRKVTIHPSYLNCPKYTK